MSSLKSKSELSGTSVYKRLEEELLYLVWQVYNSFVKNIPFESVKAWKLITNKIIHYDLHSLQYAYECSQE